MMKIVVPITAFIFYFVIYSFLFENFIVLNCTMYDSTFDFVITCGIFSELMKFCIIFTCTSFLFFRIDGYPPIYFRNFFVIMLLFVLACRFEFFDFGGVIDYFDSRPHLLTSFKSFVSVLATYILWYIYDTMYVANRERQLDRIMQSMKSIKPEEFVDYVIEHMGIQKLSIQDRDKLIQEFVGIMDKHQLPEDRSKFVKQLNKKLEKQAFIGRNTPCSCGSGLRFKNCCGKIK